MPKYNVTIGYRAYPVFEVEADSQEEAEATALDMADPADFDPADFSVDVFDCEEIE